MYSLTHKQLNGRIASAFLYLSRQVFKSDSFNMILSRNELANFTAMSTMSAVRTINGFKKQGIITDKNGIIEIKDFEALEKISKSGWSILLRLPLLPNVSAHNNACQWHRFQSQYRFLNIPYLH